MNEDEIPKLMGEVIQIDEARIRGHLGEMVRGTAEEAQNAMLDAEADRPCGARIAMNAARDARTRGLGLVKGRRTSGLAGSA